MTVINMMSFGDSGAAVADEQTTSGNIRKYNSAQKLKLIDSSTIYGGSGSSFMINEVYDAMEYTIKEQKEKNMVGGLNIMQLYDLAKRMIGSVKNSKKNDFLFANFGITLDEFVTGLRNGVKLDEPLKGKAYDALNNENFNRNIDLSILIGGLYEGKFEINYVDSRGTACLRIPQPYYSIGSGSDEAGKILSRYVINMPREKREKIPIEEGLVKLIEATSSASDINVGVGGIPSIVYLSKGSVKIPNENQCVLATEIVEGYVRNILDRDFTFRSISDLVLNNADFRTVEEQMKSRAKDWNQLDKILRGYKE